MSGMPIELLTLYSPYRLIDSACGDVGIVGDNDCPSFAWAAKDIFNSINIKSQYLIVFCFIFFSFAATCRREA